MNDNAVTIFWFRRDLRLNDNAALHHALQGGVPVLPLFIFDADILEPLSNRADRRVAFIHAALKGLDQTLRRTHSGIVIRQGRPLQVWQEVLEEHTVIEVHANRDYEPYALKRDQEIGELLRSRGIPFHLSKDQLIFDRDEIVTGAGGPYTVYTPYKNKWLSRLTPNDLAPYDCERHLERMASFHPPDFPALSGIGFAELPGAFAEPRLDETLLRDYHLHRDYPALSGTSRMSAHLRFGTVSIRALVRQAREWNQTWLQELVWREFFSQILFHFPQVVDQPFKKAYAAIPWRENESDLARWCDGQTGYPMVDAGMRELNQTGFMHNRVRMITAGFLCKHLLLPWLWGERYFAEKLLDYDLASNNGNWQWAAGCGCDAAPYFRVFNPELQQQKFDPQQHYIRRWVPELGTPRYPAPMVFHAAARIRAITTYRSALAGATTPA